MLFPSHDPGTSGFPVDMAFERGTTFTDPTRWWSRLTGVKYLESSSTAAESSGSGTPWDYENGWYSSAGASNDYSWMFRRAPGFFDVVCYTGTGVVRTVDHNLGVAPELMIVKCRNVAGSSWLVYSATTGAGDQLHLNANYAAYALSQTWNNTAPTASVFTVGTNGDVNLNSYLFVSYLFATVPGVSKVGSYTGTATTNQIDCGFSSGARFVLIKRI